MSDEGGNQSVDRLVPIEHDSEAANPARMENLPSLRKSGKSADLSQEQKGEPNWRKWAVVVSVVFGVFAALLGSGLYWRARDAYRESRPPNFKVSCEGEQGSGACVYEITEELAFIGSDLGGFEITISADYAGDDIVGPVEVRLLDADSAMRQDRRWENFQTHHQDSLSFSLTASDLFEYSGLAPDPRALAPTLSDPPPSQTGRFEIQVLHEGELLASEAITVLNTPWLHSTPVSYTHLTLPTIYSV